MRRRLLPLLGLLALLLAGCSAIGGTPRAVAPETRHDFGDLPTSLNAKDRRFHEFVIRNEGTGDLKLQEPELKLLEGC